MSAEIVPERLDQLVSARLAAATQPPTDREVVRALRPMAPADHDDARWTAAVLASLGRVRGRSGAEEGAGAFPAGATWKQITERFVPALALGVGPGDAGAHRRLSDRDAWAAAVVARAMGLWAQGEPPPTAPSVSDELVWARLALGGRAKRLPPEVRAHFLASELGAPRAAADRLLRQLAANLVGAARADLRALREALARRWLCGQEWSGEATGRPGRAAEPSRDAPAREAPGPARAEVVDGPAREAASPARAEAPAGWPAAETASEAPAAGREAPAAGREATPAAGREARAEAALEEFAAAVRGAATEATEGLFGDRKVFIAAVWRRLVERAPFAGLSLDEFKRRLIDAHRAGLVRLARADLVGAMDPDQVAASQTDHLEAQYHFVEREGEP